MTHPSQRLDDVVHQRVRLGVLTILNEAESADFGYLKKALGLTDGNLSRHLAVLEEAGFVSVRKTFDGKRPRTWLSATRAGKTALAAELKALRELLAGVGGTAPATGVGSPGGHLQP